MTRYATFAVLATAAAGCWAAMPAHADDVCPKRGGTLTYVYTPEPVALSTLRTTGVPVAMIAPKIYEGLLQYDGPEMKPVAGLAQSWEISPDHLSYSFKLRSDVKWQDGQPFTADDVKYSIEHADKPYHTRGDVFFAQLDSIETPDPQTVVFKLKIPVPFFLQAFQPGYSPMLPKHILEKVDVNSREAVTNSSLTGTEPVGTGPFMLKEWVKGDHITLVRNPNYWQKGLPCLDQVVLRVIPDGSARAIAVENGEVDLAPMNALPYPDVDRLKKNPQFEISEKGTEGLGTDMWLDLNLRDKPLSDVKVRRAISLALDRKAIVNVIWYGYGQPARGPIVSTNSFFDKSLAPLPYDLKAAAALLDEAGYKPDASGVRFELKQYNLPYGDQYVRLGEYIRQQLRKIGIEVKTQSLDVGGWLKAVFTDQDYQITSTFTDNRLDPTIGSQRLFTTPFIRKGATFQNSMAYSNSKIDQLFVDGAVESDPAKRQAIFNQVQQILQTELPVIPLVELPNVSVWNKRVHGVLTNGLSYYGGWEKVWKD